MTSILTIFFLSLLFSLVLTPLAGLLGKKMNVIDFPGIRKIHTETIPRTGGSAIFLSFFLAILISNLFHTSITERLVLEKNTLFLIIGGISVFAIGLLDDITGVDAKIKFALQILGASVAFFGGAKITFINLVFIKFETGIFSYLITVFWFVLFINAVNLIDGLDGLAGGVSFFASLVMIVLLIFLDKLHIALLYAALAGSLLGFLRYNFNPASIFMGDSGSYFIGYTLAALSIIGSAKIQMGAVMLIPVLALGVPLFDTVLSPIRRFIVGRGIFQPDSEHIHHKLLKMGLTTRKAVLVLYAISLGLCILAVAIANMQNETAGLILSVIVAFSLLFVRKLGYLEYFAMDKIYGWFRDMTDTAGISKERRSFLDIQMDIISAPDELQLWKGIQRALYKLRFDMAELCLKSEGDNMLSPKNKNWKWCRNGYKGACDFDQDRVMRIELPMIGKDGVFFGNILLIKDMRDEQLNDFTFRRVEHLRRSVVGALEKMKKKELLSPP